MAVSAHYSLFYRPWVGARTKQLDVVVRFDDHNGASFQIVLHVFRDFAEIGGKSNLHPLCPKAEADGIDGVMGDTEGHHIDVPDTEAEPGREVFFLRELWHWQCLCRQIWNRQSWSRTGLADYSPAHSLTHSLRGGALPGTMRRCRDEDRDV